MHIVQCHLKEDKSRLKKVWWRAYNKLQSVEIPKGGGGTSLPKRYPADTTP